MEKANNDLYAMSNPAVLAALGNFVHQARLQQNKTQQEVATSAGINRSTLVQIENGGGGTLLTFIQVLRALEQLHLFQVFEMQQSVSPLLLAKLDKMKRKRASGKRVNPTANTLINAINKTASANCHSLDDSSSCSGLASRRWSWLVDARLTINVYPSPKNAGNNTIKSPRNTHPKINRVIWLVNNFLNVDSSFKNVRT